MATKVLVTEASDPLSPELITVTIAGVQCADRARVLKALAYLFDGGSEWDGPPPNVRLVVEHTGEIPQA